MEANRPESNLQSMSPERPPSQADFQPLVSVYIPTKNRLALLQRALRSVFEQTYPHIEIVVADDGSTDGTRPYLQRLAAAGKLRVVLMPASMGACVARNFAIAEATGAFVTGLDDDDYFLAHRIEAFVDQWRQIGRAQPIAGLYQPARLLLRNGQEIVFASERQTSAQLRQRNTVGNHVFAPRAHFIEAGLFDPAMPCWQDWDLWTRMAMRYGPFIGSDKAGYVWDMSDATGHISGKPAFQIRHGYRMLLHKCSLERMHERAGPLTTLSLYPQVRLSTGELLTLVLTGHWRHAARHLLRAVAGDALVERLRLFIRNRRSRR